MIAVIKRHSVLTYFVLTFAISWSGILVLAVFYGMPATSEQSEKLGSIVYLPFLLGPCIASIVLTGLVIGKAGFRELLSRLFRWRVGTLWYAAAILILPVTATVILLMLSLISPVFIPDIITANDKVGLLIAGILTGLIGGGLLEETGWTGFAVPRLRLRYGSLATGLIVGFVWGTWHILPVFWGSGNASGELDLSLFLPGLFFFYAGLTPFRVLMVWVYDHTESVFVSMLMHMTLTAGIYFILNISATGFPLFVYYLILAVSLWIFVAVVRRHAVI
jgi:membrane protease YdiL (CAAX protease family)